MPAFKQAAAFIVSRVQKVLLPAKGLALLTTGERVMPRDEAVGALRGGFLLVLAPQPALSAGADEDAAALALVSRIAARSKVLRTNKARSCTLLRCW